MVLKTQLLSNSFQALYTTALITENISVFVVCLNIGQINTFHDIHQDFQGLESKSGSNHVIISHVFVAELRKRF